MRAAFVLAILLVPPVPANGAARPAYGGEIRVLVSSAPRVVDPALAINSSDLMLVRALHSLPLEIDGEGHLSPGLLEEVPVPEAAGRAFRLLLRSGLRFADGTPLGAADVAASLGRLLSSGSAHAWVALPILGADAFLDGRALVLPGVEVLSDRELLVTLAFPMPEWPFALAAPTAAVVSRGGEGAGPFRLKTLDGSGARLEVNPFHWRGRAFADRLLLKGADARAAARALSRGEADLVQRPEAFAGARSCPPTPPLLVTVAVLNPRRLGSETDHVRNVIQSIDRAELARRFARGPSAPMETLVPPALLPAPGPNPRPVPAGDGARPVRLALLALADAPDQRAVAGRLQVKLFDAGLRASAEVEGPSRFAARFGAEDYDVALVAVPVLSLAPSLAAGQVALATRGPMVARRVLAEMAGLSQDAAFARAEELTRALDLVPLFATGERNSAGPGLEGLRVFADGGFDPGELWRLEGENR